MVEVTQEDREAAASYYYSCGGSYNIARDIREGRKDDWFRVQAFARHRIAAFNAGQKAMREAAAKVAENHNAATAVIADAIRNLKIGEE